MSEMKKLPVTLDVTPVVYGRGVSRYTSNLARALANNRQVELTMFGSNWGLWPQLKGFADTMEAHVDNSFWKLPPWFLRSSWSLTGLPKPLTNQGVFHAWDWQVPPWKKVGLVVSIYDLAYKIFPQTAHPKIKRHYDHLISQIEASPNIHVITTSQASREDILRLTKIDEQRVHMVYPGLPTEAQIVPTEDEMQVVKSKFDLHKPFLLFVGTTEPRKNLKNIIAAWEKVKDQFELVIVGAQGWDNFEVKAGMHVLGYVSSAELAALYRQAQALMYVSLYEGFGLPILEAYFHRCPVITSNCSSMSEVAGSPAVLVDPQNPEEIAEAVISLEDKSSKARQRREEDMQQVLKQYSWERTAQQTIAVYQMAREL